ncbi:hypothetical protein AB6A40_007167 [Gnathostoma spinigerum]|uniref:Uncharacterized protein n=1 Tax=Gnathostoma spinigerum TaxID=75299 RepID=A0ABD6ETU0_9BILA
MANPLSSVLHVLGFCLVYIYSAKSLPIRDRVEYTDISRSFLSSIRKEAMPSKTKKYKCVYIDDDDDDSEATPSDRFFGASTTEEIIPQDHRSDLRSTVYKNHKQKIDTSFTRFDEPIHRQADSSLQSVSFAPHSQSLQRMPTAKAPIVDGDNAYEFDSRDKTATDEEPQQTSSISSYHENPPQHYLPIVSLKQYENDVTAGQLQTSVELTTQSYSIERDSSNPSTGREPLSPFAERVVTNSVNPRRLSVISHEQSGQTMVEKPPEEYCNQV